MHGAEHTTYRSSFSSAMARLARAVAFAALSPSASVYNRTASSYRPALNATFPCASRRAAAGRHMSQGRGPAWTRASEPPDRDTTSRLQA